MSFNLLNDFQLIRSSGEFERKRGDKGNLLSSLYFNTFREIHPENRRRILTGLRANLLVALLSGATRRGKLKLFQSRSSISPAFMERRLKRLMFNEPIMSCFDTAGVLLLAAAEKKTNYIICYSLIRTDPQAMPIYKCAVEITFPCPAGR